jgi:hypothetical protein
MLFVICSVYYMTIVWTSFTVTEAILFSTYKTWYKC